VSIVHHFDASPRIWVTSLGLSGIIGAALILSTRSSSGYVPKMDPWVVFRLFLMPFCVSSFAALVKNAGYMLVFPPSWRENVIGTGLISFFLFAVWILKKHQAAKGTPYGSSSGIGANSRILAQSEV
jgi:hypothetical protein